MNSQPSRIPASEVRPLGGAADIEAARAAARQAPSGLGLALFAVGASFLAALLVFLFINLDYRFGQAPHRLVKILIGAAAMGVIALKPKLGLLSIPIAVPFLGWLPKLPIPGMNSTNALVFGVYLCWALGRIANRQPIVRRASLGLPLGLFAGICLLGLVRGAAVPVSTQGQPYVLSVWGLDLFRSLSPIFIYFVGSFMLESEKERRLLAWSIVIGFLLESVATLVLGGNGFRGRAAGTLGQSNELGAYLAMMAPLCLTLLPVTRSWAARGALVGGLGLGLWAEFLTLSRGGLLAMGVALWYAAWRTSRMLGLLITTVLLTSPFWVPGFVVDRVLETTRAVEDTEEVELAHSAQLRVDTWKAILQVVADHPLDGVGYGALGIVLPEMRGSLASYIADSSHNSYLRVQAELGLFGTLAFLLLLGACWYQAERAVRGAGERFQRQVSVGFQAALLALATSCAFGDRFFSLAVMGNFWVMAALQEHWRPGPAEARA